MASRSALFLLLCCLIASSSAQSVTVRFETTSYSVSESIGAVIFQVSAMFSADAPEAVTVTISGFPAPNIMSMDFNISGNETQMLMYPIVNDNLLGDDLVMFDVMLTSVDASVEVSVSTATVNITEDDTVTIGFEQEMYSVYEGFVVEVCVNLSSGGLAAERTVVVSLSTDDMLGSGGMLVSMDYVPLTMDLTFSDAIPSVCVNLTTIFNAGANSVSFNVNLTTMEPPTAVILIPLVTTINILDVVVPTIVTQPMSIENAFPDTTVNFTVTADGGALSYQWSRNGDEIEGATQAILILMNVTIENEGTYSCFIYNLAGNTTTDEVSLTVLRRPTITLEVPIGAVLNQEITLTCTAAVNATITLTVMNSEGTSLALTDVELTGNSRSVNVMVITTGQHTVTCIADNNGLMETVTALFYGITIEVANVTAGITATAVFFCNVTGASGAAVRYIWTQTVNGVIPETRFPPVIYEDRIIGLTTPTLMIPNLSGLEQDFDYTCTVSIGGMRIGSGTGTLTSPGPVILVGPDDQERQAGERLVLGCSGQNNEDATMPLRVNWFFTSFDSQFPQRLYTINDSEVTEIRLPDNIIVNSTFVIDPVMATDGGMYGCQVSNRDGVLPVEQNATVIVFFTPQIRFIASPNPVPRGGNPLLTCTVTAEPSANYSEIVRIFPDGSEELVANASNPTGMREFQVTYPIPSVRFPQDDGAEFECRSLNANGPEDESITIIVQAPPNEIDHATVTAVLTSLDNVSVTWSIPAENNADIQSYNLLFCTIETGCVEGTLRNVTLMVGDEELITIGGNRLRYTLSQLLIDREYEVMIRAENSVGQQMSPAFGDGLRFNSASPDDGRVVNVASISSTSMIILTWNLPPLANATTTNLNVSFNVTYFSVSDLSNIISVAVEYNASLPAQGVSVDLMMADSANHTFQIVALYTNPNLLSSQAILTGVRTLAIGGTLLTGPEAVVSNSVSSDDVLTVSWPAPMNTSFLDSYRVFFTTSSARSRRQTSSPVNVSAGMTSTTLPFTPFTDFTVNVDAIYTPPPNGTGVVIISLLPPTTFTTPQRASSPPLDVVPMNETMDGSVIKIRLTWRVPTTPNGIITGYRIVGSTSGQADFTTTEMGANTLTFLSVMLLPNTKYTFRVAAINGPTNEPPITGMFSPDTIVYTSFSVVQPVISSTAVGESGNPLFTITTGSFSDELGGVDSFKVVVVRGSRVEPRNVPDSSLLPAGQSQFNYYVAYYGDLNRVQRSGTTITIGDNVATIDDRDSDMPITFTNPPPELGEDYFVFIRLYSSIDPSVFADSSLAGVLRINRPLDPAVIIAPIAVVAVVLLIILVVLLVVVFLFTRPRRGYTIAATGEDGVHRKKRGGALELRRTRLFSPVVNVPVPDVFTSAGQPTTLVCEASGTPAPDVVWTQNNEPLDKERFIQLADASLFVNDTDLKDEGAYIVTATNSAGTAEQMVRVTVIRPSPPEPDPDHPPIQVGEFTEKIALLRANDDEGLEDEYSEVEPDITFTSYAAKININKNKNRYINIIPYDHSRVVLSLQDNTPGSDYINASYLDGFNRPNAYIATQGPQPSTFPDFWRMVWEFDCPTIVMVTNLKEEDKLKCHQYWPNYGTTTYGNIQVTLKGVENLAEYSIRTFHITPIAGQSRVQMPAREVKQFHFLVWPDHGVPQFATPLLSFRKRVAKYHPDKKGPMVVHCSAGVGRTGTFVTIDTMLRQMEAEGVTDIFNYVRHMRFRRNYMVQTAPQYVFIHDALLEAIMCGDNSIPAPELRKRFQDLMEVDPESNKSRLQLQFENLNSNSPQDDDFDSTIAGLPDNMAKNRFKVHLPANDYRVPLGAPPPRSEGGDDDDDEDEKEKEAEEPDYICASFADGYRQRNAFIITQAPMSNTTGDFWKMIWEQKSAAIVMLTELEEDGKEMSVKYWPGEVGEASLFGSFQLELSEDEKDKGDYVTRKFKLSHVDAPQDCRIVTQFHFTKWARSSTPKDTHSVIDLIDEIQRVQRKSGNQPITIHCDDGISRTGAFCTLYSVLERVKVDQVVDVYLATKTLRIQRAGLLETLDQYIFVHKAVIEFLDSFSDYQNFK